MTCGVALAPTADAAQRGAGTPVAQGGNLAKQSDAQLAALAKVLDDQARGIGQALLEADVRQGEASDERDLALRQLNAWLADAYKKGGSSMYVSELIAAGSIAQVGERVRLVRAVGSHKARLVSSLDAAEARLDVGTLRRAELIRTMTQAQARLEQVHAEQGLRQAVALDKLQQRQVAAAERAAEKAAAAAPVAPTMPAGTLGIPGALVAYATGNAASTGPISPVAIDQYLASKGSPMAGQGAAFVQSGMRWGVDPRLLVAIAGAESNFGQITCGPNNAWGWACPNDPESFATWAAGIDTVTRGLRRYYLDEGRTSVSLIQQKYCPVGATNDPTGLNNHWHANVTKFLVELGGNPGNVGAGPAGGPAVPDIGGIGLGTIAE